jgi:hypothetical protein
MHTDSTSIRSTGAEPEQDPEARRWERHRERQLAIEQSGYLALYVIAVSAAAERWLPNMEIGITATWLTPLCWGALLARHASSEGTVLDTRTAQGRRRAERAAWRTLVTTFALSTVLLVPFALLATATAFLSWWQRIPVCAGVGLLVGLLGRFWRVWRSRPSA